jgi:hypothetical protein
MPFTIKCRGDASVRVRTRIQSKPTTSQEVSRRAPGSVRSRLHRSGFARRRGTPPERGADPAGKLRRNSYCRFSSRIANLSGTKHTAEDRRAPRRVQFDPMANGSAGMRRIGGNERVQRRKWHQAGSSEHRPGGPPTGHRYAARVTLPPHGSLPATTAPGHVRRACRGGSCNL